MPKRVIAILWVAGTVIIVAGGWALLSVASQAKPGSSLHDHPVASITLLALCYSVTLTGVALGLVAWAGALASTYQLARKTWFYVLLWLGTAGLAASPLVIGGVVWWGLMLIYLVAGPDRPAPPSPPASPLETPGEAAHADGPGRKREHCQVSAGNLRGVGPAAGGLRSLMRSARRRDHGAREMMCRGY